MDHEYLPSSGIDRVIRVTLCNLIICGTIIIVNLEYVISAKR